MTRERMKREISACFLPKCYFDRGTTKKELFKIILRKKMKSNDTKRANIRTLT